MIPVPVGQIVLISYIHIFPMVNGYEFVYSLHLSPYFKFEMLATGRQYTIGLVEMKEIAVLREREN